MRILSFAGNVLRSDNLVGLSGWIVSGLLLSVAFEGKSTTLPRSAKLRVYHERVVVAFQHYRVVLRNKEVLILKRSLHH